MRLKMELSLVIVKAVRKLEMGGCVSTSHSRVAPHRKKYTRHSRKGHGKISTPIFDAPIKRLSDAGSRISVSEFVQIDFAKGGTTTCRRSEVSNKSLHVTQVHWNHVDENGICQEEAWFDSVSILDSESDDDFSSVFGGSQLIRPQAGLLVPCTNNEKGAPAAGLPFPLQCLEFVARLTSKTNQKVQHQVTVHILPLVLICSVLPSVQGYGKLLSLLIVNIQMPAYSSSMFMGDTDGEGVSLVLYFKLSDNIDEEIPSEFIE